MPLDKHTTFFIFEEFFSFIMDISIIIPVFNEASCLEKSLLSLVAQSYPIRELIVVDDGSTDNTLTIASKIVDKYDFVHLVVSDVKSSHHPGQKVIAAFERGFSSLQHPWDVICKFDADIIFPENYIETLVNSFSQNPNLGMFGGLLQIENNGVWEYETVSSDTHVRGPIKSYTKNCFAAIGGLRPALGWDTLDEFLAMYNGFSVKTDKKLIVKHLKPTGSSYVNSMTKAKGEVFYKLGYGLVLGMLACAKWAFKQGKGLWGVMNGFLTSWLMRKPKFVTKKEARFIRKLRWSLIRKRFVS